MDQFHGDRTDDRILRRCADGLGAEQCERLADPLAL